MPTGFQCKLYASDAPPASGVAPGEPEIDRANAFPVNVGDYVNESLAATAALSGSSPKAWIQCESNASPPAVFHAFSVRILAVKVGTLH
jgi:hypothetical protein